MAVFVGLKQHLLNYLGKNNLNPNPNPILIIVISNPDDDDNDYDSWIEVHREKKLH